MEDRENEKKPEASNTDQETPPTEASSRGNWPLWISAIQTLVMALTFAGAVYIGFKQVEIGLQQTQIEIQQTEINRLLYDLNFTPSVEVTFSPDPGEERLNVHNRGRDNFWLYAVRVFDRPTRIEEGKKYLIAPNGFYYIPAAEMVRRGRQLFEADDSRTLIDFVDERSPNIAPGLRSRRVPAEVFIETANGNRYVVDMEWRFVMDEDGKLDVHTQAQGIRTTDWGKDSRDP